MKKVALCTLFYKNHVIVRVIMGIRICCFVFRKTGYRNGISELQTMPDMEMQTHSCSILLRDLDFRFSAMRFHKKLRLGSSDFFSESYEFRVIPLLTST